jgi:tetratricopeptide (TPR) repeat protein
MEPTEDVEQLANALREFLADQYVLIVNSVGSSRISLASCLAKFGASREKMLLVSSISEARYEIQKVKPRFVFTDYMIGSDPGLDLLQEQRKNYSRDDLKRSIFVLVTSNASQSAVAQAAEEDVDTFIVRPYSIDLLGKTLARTAIQKMNPGKYLELIERGKEQLFLGKFDEALSIFEDAMLEHEQPTLACFYAGQAEFMKLSMGGAEQRYEQGLSYNKIHYKCLVGLYDLLMSQKKFEEAYDIVRRISQYFPANPKRLGAVLRLAVMTEHFQDIESYYNIFLKIGERTDELTKSMCSALVVAGKFYLRISRETLALSLFESAAISAAGRTQFINYIVENLVDYKMREDAERFLERLRKLSMASKDFRIARFMVSTLQDDRPASIQMGTTLIEEGIETSGIYEKMIAQLTREQNSKLADALLQTAIQKWPERKADFNYARETLSREAAN